MNKPKQPDKTYHDKVAGNLRKNKGRGNEEGVCKRVRLIRKDARYHTAAIV